MVERSPVCNPLSQLATMRAPYEGTIRHIKYLGQTNDALNVEIILVATGR
ncbi:MAG TPA: hypothetical protein V6D12_08925 [Candidatus Obscuribacterales bacterium]